MSNINELARRIRDLETQQQFLGSSVGIEDPFVNALARNHSFVMGLPALRAYWTMGILNASGGVIDSSGIGVTLTRHNTLMHNAASVRRGIFFNGSTAYLSRADGAAVDYSGANSALFSTVRGLTISAWIRPNILGGQQGIVCKWTGGGNLSYIMQIPSALPNRISVAVSGNGTSEARATAPADFLQASTYYNVILRYTPSTSIELIVDGVVSDTNTTSIPSSIYNSTVDLNIGCRANGTTDFYNGYISDVFVCDTPLRDDTIQAYYNLTAPMYKQ